jgi:hypothetical protein
VQTQSIEDLPVRVGGVAEVNVVEGNRATFATRNEKGQSEEGWILGRAPFQMRGAAEGESLTLGCWSFKANMASMSMAD